MNKSTSIQSLSTIDLVIMDADVIKQNQPELDYQLCKDIAADRLLEFEQDENDTE